MVLTIFNSAMGQSCGYATNHITTETNPDYFWVLNTSEQLTSGTGETNALASCQTLAGITYCPSDKVAPSGVIVKPCTLFRQAGVTTMPAALDTYWCCTNEDTWDMVNGILTGDGGTAVNENIIVPCLIGGNLLSAANCIQGFSTNMPADFGVTLGGLVLCKDVGIGSSSTLYCALSLGAADIKTNYQCPGDRYAFGTGLLGGPLYSVSTTGTSYTGPSSGASYTYYTVSKFSTAVCLCQDGYYGPVHTPTSVDTADCTACPCQQTKNGEICGQTSTYANIRNTTYLQAIGTAGGVIPATFCNIQCTSADGCFDDTGTYIHNSACAYSM